MSMQPFATADEMYDAAADRFCQVVTDTIDSGMPVRVSLSGGSTPKRLYELLAQRDLPWSQIHWFWGDERNVPPDHADSNYRMVQQALLEPIGAKPENVHPVPVDVDNPDAAAKQYEQTLREHFAGQSFPKWTIALLGMGDDGHTASLFPHTQALDQQQRWFVENWVEKFDAFRYTLTAPAITSAEEAWFLITGSAKRDALSHVRSDHQDPHTYPAQLITPTAWFVTSDAWQ